MEEENEYSLYDDLDMESADSLSTDDLDVEAFAYGYEATGGSTGEEAVRLAKEFQRRKDAREKAGLTSERLFEFAEETGRIAAGGETEAERRTRRSLEVLAGSQRSMARAGTGFGAAQRGRMAERSAQRVETVGAARMAEAKELQMEAAEQQLEQILIQGEQRYEDRQYQMAMMQAQRDAASGNIFGSILEGVLSAVGAGVGFVASGGNPAVAVLGGMAGKASGSIGRFIR